MIKRKLKILRSAVGSPPSFGFIKELQKNNIEVVGIDSNPLSFGLYNIEKAYLVPPGDSPDFLNEIIKIIEKEGPDAILSGPEQEILVFSKNKTLLEKKGVMVLCPDYDSVVICSDKEKTCEKFKELGIPFPEIYSAENIKFPCIIKPKSGRGSSDVYKIENQEQFDILIKKIKNPIIQEFVKGEEYSIDILSDRDGNCLSVVPRLRINVESGVSMKGRTVYDKEITDYCKKIVKELKLFGPSCIQCIRNNNNQLKFIEINLRFGGGSILSIKADPTIIPNLIKLIKKQDPVPSSSFKQGLYMFRNYCEIYVDENNLKNSNENRNF